MAQSPHVVLISTYELGHQPFGLASPAAWLAASLVERVQRINPNAHLCFYGLYAPVNEEYLRELGAGTILGGEFEEGLVALVERLSTKGTQPPSPSGAQPEPAISLTR